MHKHNSFLQLTKEEKTLAEYLNDIKNRPPVIALPHVVGH